MTDDDTARDLERLAAVWRHNGMLVDVARSAGEQVRGLVRWDDPAGVPL